MSTAMAELRSEEISYSADGVTMKGYIAWDDSVEGQRPGVLVVHEWWGHNDYPRKRADMLAELGYTALALDMYGDGRTADHPEDAQKFMQELTDNLESSRARFDAALAQLKAHDTVDTNHIAAIGYCLGGGLVLHMARYGADLDAVASFHGSLPLAVAPDGEGAPVTARVVAYNGEADPFVPQEAIDAFQREMEVAGADYQFINMPGAVHGFSNPAATDNGEKFGLPLKYDALADESSWAHMRLLLQTAFADEG
ncbi:dienelactone hydrolase family protein [Wenzhouxiangellaceae bacterium CH-27]|uniref:Dienelactone hydrolase family protein n=1 Tax=Elongatibacter sediminis TaxID=3119006 RepID=A0AAW9RFC1_9GAMM